MEERRKLLRQRVLKSAKIVYNRDHSVVDCMVRNISTNGAQLSLPNTLGIPPRFDLRLEADGQRLGCEVIWRHAQRIGVRFIGR